MTGPVQRDIRENEYADKESVLNQLVYIIYIRCILIKPKPSHRLSQPSLGSSSYLFLPYSLTEIPRRNDTSITRLRPSIDQLNFASISWGAAARGQGGCWTHTHTHTHTQAGWMEIITTDVSHTQCNWHRDKVELGSCLPYSKQGLMIYLPSPPSGVCVGGVKSKKYVRLRQSEWERWERWLCATAKKEGNTPLLIAALCDSLQM